MSLLGGFDQSARTRGWAGLDRLRRKQLIKVMKQMFACVSKE